MLKKWTIKLFKIVYFNIFIIAMRYSACSKLACVYGEFMKIKHIVKPLQLSLVSFALLAIPQNLSAQDNPTPTPPIFSADSITAEGETPWLYENSDIPIDKSWTFGVLKNGLRYAVKKNRVPAGQVSIRVRVDAGSLHENDDELGYAHLVEHLAFRGSTYVEDGEAKRIWQRFGVTFGSDSNAQTTPTHTVYQLDIPSITNDTLGESVKILSGMIRNPGFSEKAVEAEKLIVQAEKREGDGAQRRLSDAIRKHLFQNQRLSQRLTIGTVETLQKASAEGLAAFHKRWYRPEKTVIVMSGDADPLQLAALIEEYFSDWNVTGKAGVQPDFGQPKMISSDVKEVATVVSENGVSDRLTLFYARPWFLKNDTIVYNEQLLINSVAVQILNRRLEAEARKGKDFLFAQVAQDDISRSTNATFVTVIPTENGWDKAVLAVRAIIEDAINTPPSQADIDREVNNFADQLKTLVDSYPFENSRRQVDSIVSAVDIRETVAAPDTIAMVFNDLRPRITGEAILSSSKALFEAPVKRIVLTGQTENSGDQQKLANVLNVKVAANSKARLADTVVDLNALPDLGPAGKLVSTQPVARFDSEVLEFSNGVRAFIQPNKAEAGQVRVIVRFGAGYQSVEPENGEALWAAPFVLPSNGIGDLRQEELDQLAINRRLSLNFSIAQDAFEFTAATRPEDLEGQLQLIAAKISKPAWDPAPVERIKSIVKQNEASANLTAQSVLQRDLEYLFKSKDLRWKKPQGKELDAFNADLFRKTWEPLLKTGPIEVVVFGDFEKTKLVPALERTFGALEPRTVSASSLAAKTIAFPKANKVSKELFHEGPKDQAAAVIAWPTGGGTTLLRNSRHLEILSAILRDRLFESFRSEEAASYSPDFASDWPKAFDSGGHIFGYSQVQPKNVDRFFAAAKEIAADLKANPVSADELKRAIEPIKQQIERASTGNTFWMQQLKGVSYDRNKLAELSTLYRDLTTATPLDIQRVAQTYLIDENIWTLKVLPKP